MNFIGLDLSLNGTGVVTLDEEKNVLVQELITSSPKQQMEPRLIGIRDNIIKLIDDPKQPKSVYIEGLSYASVGSSNAELAAIHYLVRIYLYEKNTDFSIVTPPQLKKFVTGKGNSKKSLMIKNVYKNFGFDTEDDNIADAYGLARMAFEEYMKIS